ncbi:hypothetical protein HHI36_020083 [Cryptolaemus montrouzieri]|uniref:Uncharacterized protein n=1 Tax=Cryptolaemus montrouzieri TaxID=559131 RepID=A0ABD2N962_9CUCU
MFKYLNENLDQNNITLEYDLKSWLIFTFNFKCFYIFHTMDLIDQSKKTLYEKCKYKVKVWEHNFKKTNGRLPCKLDIKEALPEVRNAYKTYFQLKTAALEQTFVDVDGFNSDEEQQPTELKENNFPNTLKTDIHNDLITASTSNFTWGSHLNKTPSEKKIDKPTEPSPNLNLKITKKLSMGSKIIKRNPRKSLSQVKSDSSINLSQKNSDSTPLKPLSFSQPPVQMSSLSSLENDLKLESSHFFGMKHTKIVSTSNFTASQPINIIDKVLNKKNETEFKFKDIDIEWLKRVENSTKTMTVELESEVTKTDLISDEDIIDNSDDESSKSAFHIAKKIKYNNTSLSTSLTSSQKVNLIKANSSNENFHTNNLAIQKSIEIPVSFTSQEHESSENKTLCGQQNINKEGCEIKDTIKNVTTETSNLIGLTENYIQKKSTVISNNYDDELVGKLKKKI